MTRRRVLWGAAGLAAIASGAVVLTDVERRHSGPAPTTTAAEWEVVLTRLANGLSTTADAVHAAATHPAPQLLVGVPLTAAEATVVRARRGVATVALLHQLLDRNPTLTRLASRDGPPAARTVRASLTRPTVSSQPSCTTGSDRWCRWRST